MPSGVVGRLLGAAGLALFGAASAGVAPQTVAADAAEDTVSLLQHSHGARRSAARDEPASSSSGLEIAELQQEPRAPARSNYCGQGKLLPELYVLGPMSTCTSSLWLDLRSSLLVDSSDGLSKVGFVTAPNNETKEWNVFQHTSRPPDEVYESWLSNFTPCPEERVLMVDMSVSNIASIPSPPDFTVDGWGAENWDAPALISRFHNQSGVRPPYLMVMLRDPLVRIHSEYYHMLDARTWTEGVFGQPVNSTFVADFAADEALLRKKQPVVSEWFWKSFTARGVEEYLKYFPASQFMFVPIHEYTNSPANFSKGLFERVGVNATPWQAASHTNEHPRPSVDEELPPGARARADFEAFFAPEVRKLVKLIADAHTQGAWLVGYEGEPGNRFQVHKWLVSNW